MLLKKPTIKIDPSDPFKEDELKRSESAEILTQLLQSIDEPFVLAIDSGWGTGKTTFIKMWKQYLQNDGFNCLYFNAWENDFHDDPLISFIGEIESTIDNLDKKRKPKAKRYLKKTKEVGFSLLKQSIPLAARILSSGLVDTNTLTGKDFSDLAVKIAQEKTASYKDDKITLEKFRESLEVFVKEITEPQNNDEERKSLVFFIDELDRCKPTYAIELLERLKHLFNVTGIVFVIALAKDEIAHSIKSLYGEIDADGYLRRFIDLDYKLPDIHPDMYCRYLFQKFGFSEFFKNRLGNYNSNDNIHLLEIFIELSLVFNFSLRVQEQCFSQFSIALRTIEFGYSIYPIFLATLISLKAANKPLYQDYIKGNSNYNTVLEYLRNENLGAKFVNGDYGGSIEAHMIFNDSSDDQIEDLCKQLDKERTQDNIGPKQKKRKRVMLSTLQTLNNGRLSTGGLLKSVVKRIEISERFE